MCFASFLVIIFRVDDKFAVVESSLYWSIPSDRLWIAWNINKILGL